MPRASWLCLAAGFAGAASCLFGAGAAWAERPAIAVAIEAAQQNRKVGVRLPLFYRSRPSVSGTWLPARTEAPVIVELDGEPTPQDVVRLRQAGLRVSMREDGTAVVRDVFVSGWVGASSLSAVAALSNVVRVVADGSPLGLLPPLDVMGAEVQATDTWQQRDGLGLPITGSGQKVCVIDVGMDVYHPMFFYADGGYRPWRDVDGDGEFTSGVDTLSDGTVLRTHSSIVLDFAGGTLYGSEGSDHIAGIDWIYADINGNGLRDFGVEAGYGDDAPSFGEPLFTSDDVNDNAVVDFGERLVGLKTSKVGVFTTGNFIHTRGNNMNEAPRAGHHGTASTSIVAGGQRGFGRFVGIAPDAELMMVKTSTVAQLFTRTDFCLSRGATVVLHEYAPWQGLFLDGSSPLERVVADTMEAGVAHINPAGNLAGAKKFYKRELGRNASVDIAVDVPATYNDEAFALFGFSLLWSGDDDDLEVRLTDGTGRSITVPTGTDQQPFHSGLTFITGRQTSDRGTARVDIYVFSDEEGSVKLAPGRWVVSVRDRVGDGPYELIASLQDDLSRWDVGIHFPEFANEDHLIGFPGTADAAIVVAAHVGHGFDGDTPGTRAEKSGRGRRIDGTELLSVAAPEDPIAAAFLEGEIAPMGPFGGTSGASPHVAGAAALLMQANPAMTGVGVRDALRAGALSDFDTDLVPNSDWGYGKLRIYRSLYGSDPPAGSAPSVSIPVTHVYAGDSVTVQATIADSDHPLEALILELDRNYDGGYDEVLGNGSFTVSFEEPGAYFLKLRASDPSGRSGAAIAHIVVHPTYVPSGGLLCQVSEPPRALSTGWLLLLAAVGLGGSARRARRRACPCAFSTMTWYDEGSHDGSAPLRALALRRGSWSSGVPLAWKESP